MAATLHVFDPALGCSTGVCAPGMDSGLVRFATDLEWLGGRGFECLPLPIIDGRVASRATGPERPERLRTRRTGFAVVPVLAQEPIGPARLRALTRGGSTEKVG
jgi:hypothetical protein